LTTLNDYGLNVARIFYGIERPVMYGNRTPRLRASDPVWADASGSRLAMAIAAEGDAIMRAYVFTRSNATARARCQAELAAMLETYRTKGALYGETPQEAFTVDATSDSINPPADLEAGEFKASIAYRTSPTPDTVELQLARVSITSSLAAAA
jgi:phage tail sheath protein FI